MNEKQWASTIAMGLQSRIATSFPKLRVSTGKKLRYANELFSYSDTNPIKQQIDFETDILVWQVIDENNWIPRIVIECKLESVSTHDMLTYSGKVKLHKLVHPHLRYGILLGSMGESMLPGRVIRHGPEFDFLVAHYSAEPTDSEWAILVAITEREIDASEHLEKMLTDSRTKSRSRYSYIHRHFVVGNK